VFYISKYNNPFLHANENKNEYNIYTDYTFLSLKTTKNFSLIYHLIHNRKTKSTNTGHRLVISEWDYKRKKSNLPIKQQTPLCA